MDLDNDQPALKDQIDKMTHIIRIIRDQIEFTRFYQKVGTTDPVWQNPEEVFEANIKKFYETSIEFTATPSKIEINADPLFEKVIYNLIDNSIRHGEHVYSH